MDTVFHVSVAAFVVASAAGLSTSSLTFWNSLETFSWTYLSEVLSGAALGSGSAPSPSLGCLGADRDLTFVTVATAAAVTVAEMPTRLSNARRLAPALRASLAVFSSTLSRPTPYM